MKPTLRNKSHNDNWNKSQIKDIASFSKGQGYSKSDLTVEGDPIILYGQMYTNYKTIISEPNTFVKTKKGNVISRGGEIIVPASGETPEDIAIASVVTTPGILLGGDINVIEVDLEKLDPSFAALAITYSKTHDELSTMAQGKSVVHLHNSSISKAHLSYPAIIEQKEIVSFITVIDHQIESIESEIEKLRQLKAASLQAMFPQDGETTPRLRFKGFGGEWKEQKLSEFLEISDETNVGNVYLRDQVLSVSGDHGVVNQIKFQGRSFAGNSISNYRVTHPGQVIYTKSPLKNERFGIIKCNQYGDGILSPLYAVYSVKEGVCGDFIHYYFSDASKLNNYLNPLINKGAKNTILISDEQALEGLVHFPSTLTEQTKIADFFLNLDKQIKLTEKKLEKLRQIKASCLDLMFV